MTGPDGTTALANVLYDAALQSAYMKSRRHDLILEASGVKFLYGVDTNVMRLWGDPRTETPDSPGHAGRTFRGDESDLVTSVTLGLVNFIFESIGADPLVPLVIFPPMEKEVASVLQALHDTDPEAPSAAVQQRIDDVLERLHEAIPAEQLSQLTVELQELLFEDIGERAVLKRMLLLFSRQRVKTLEEIVARLPERVREVVLPSSNAIFRWSEYSNVRRGSGHVGAPDEGWDSRVRRTAAGKAKDRCDSDAETLARIEVWNKHLRANGETWRVLYITADRSLFEAAADYRAFAWSEGESFAEAYLRHPRAYMSEEGVLGVVDAGGAPTDEGESVGDWLAMATRPIQADLSELLRRSRTDPGISSLLQAFDDDSVIVREAGAESAGELAASLLEKWRRFAQGALVANPPPQEGLLGLGRDRKQSAKEMLDLLQAAQGKLEEERRKTLRQYLVVTTKLGQTFEAAQSARALVRSVAPIFFEDWRGAGQAVTLMSRWPDGALDEQAYQEALRLLDQDDLSPYAFYLGNASFFAARDRWRSAGLLARRARAIAKGFVAGGPQGAPAPGANGREAAYFDAVCRGNLARDRDALVAARDCMAWARTILDAEKAAGQYTEFVEERFPIQDLTLDLIDFYFVSSGPTEVRAHEPAFRPITDGFWRHYQQIVERNGPPGQDGSGSVDVGRPGAVRDTRLRVEAHLSTTVLGLSFLPQATAGDEERARLALAQLESRLAVGELVLGELGLIERAYLEGARMRGDRYRANKGTRKAFLEITATLLDERKVQLLPYEKYLIAELKRRAEFPWSS